MRIKKVKWTLKDVMDVVGTIILFLIIVGLGVLAITVM